MMSIRNVLRVLLCGFLTVFPCTVFGQSSEAHGGMQVSRAWSLALPPGATTVAVYLELHNATGQDDRLLSLNTPVALKAELHQSIQEKGMMGMRAVPILLIPANSSLQFEQGSYHAMLFDLRQPLGVGDRFPLTLHFEKAGDVQVQVEVKVQEEGAPNMPFGHHDHGMHQ